MSILLSPPEAFSLIWNALTGSGTSPKNAKYFTQAFWTLSCLVWRDMDSIGFSITVSTSAAVRWMAGLCRKLSRCLRPVFV